MEEARYFVEALADKFLHAGENIEQLGVQGRHPAGVDVLVLPEHRAEVKAPRQEDEVAADEVLHWLVDQLELSRDDGAVELLAEQVFQ